MAETNIKKDIQILFESLCVTQQPWRVFSDFIRMSACSISNSVDYSKKHHEARDKMFKGCLSTFNGSMEKPSELFGLVTMALEENPDQDFLGDMYMTLGLGSHIKGQFFTPYHVAKLLSQIDDIPTGSSWFSVVDPACGAGATLIGMANNLKEKGINYQKRTLFVGQDIDDVTALMCYVQMSLLGMPGYVVIADTLSNPIVGEPIQPVEQESQDIWYTPMFYDPLWLMQRGANIGRRKKPV